MFIKSDLNVNSIYDDLKTLSHIVWGGDADISGPLECRLVRAVYAKALAPGIS